MSEDIILLTRSQEDNIRFIKALKKTSNKAEVINLPSVKYVYFDLDKKVDIQNAGKVIVSSRRGAEWVIKNKAVFQNRIFIVIGKETASLLQKNDFGIESVFQNSDELVNFLTYEPSARFLYLRGQVVKVDLAQKLTEIGHEYTEMIVYDVVRDTEISPFLVRKLLRAETIYLPLFSPASAKFVAEKYFSEALKEMRTRTKLLCLSDAVLKSVPYEDWQDKYVCRNPNLQSMCKRVEEVSNE